MIEVHRNNIIIRNVDTSSTEYDKFVSPNVYNDLASLERKRNGKIFVNSEKRKIYKDR